MSAAVTVWSDFCFYRQRQKLWHMNCPCATATCKGRQAGGTRALVRQKRQEPQGHTRYSSTVPEQEKQVDLVTISKLILRYLDSSRVARPGDQTRKPGTNLRSCLGQRGAQPGMAMTAGAKQRLKCSSSWGGQDLACRSIFSHNSTHLSDSRLPGCTIGPDPEPRQSNLWVLGALK